MLDFARMFDKVLHLVLSAQLRQLCLSDHLLLWIADILREKRQRIV